MDEMTRIAPVIVCGGSGTRLWPASRQTLPKPFIPLVGARSTFQGCVARVAAPELFLRPVVICDNDVRFTAAEQLARMGVAADLLLEPEGRETAAAVAAALVHLRRRDPGSLVLVMSADHLVQDETAFAEACREAATLAGEGRIVTLGVPPEAQPAEGEAGDGALRDSGNLVARLDVLIEEYERLAPDILAAVQAATDAATLDLDFVRLGAAFAEASNLRFEDAILARSERTATLPARFGWSDIRTWGALWDASERDETGNVLIGDAVALEARNNLVHGDGVLTTVVGLDDVVVVAKSDAVLVASRERSDLVKPLVAALQAGDRTEVREHVRMYRPWGWYQRIDRGTRFQVKRIMVKPGASLSLQRHFHRAEHWVVVHGTAEVTVAENVTLVHENEAVYIPIGSVHRLTNPGRIDLELIEIQVGSYTGEDDIVRLEDRYGR